jgi:hypothetical protein
VSTAVGYEGVLTTRGLSGVTDLPVVDVDRIDGKPRTVRELFTPRRYSHNG